MNCIFHTEQWLRKENGYEARQTSKEQTKMPRFRLDGTRPCTIFSVFCAHTRALVHELRNKHVSIGPIVLSKQLLCFVHGLGQKSEQKPTTKNFVGFHNHSLLLTMIDRKHLPYFLTTETSPRTMV